MIKHLECSLLIAFLLCVVSADVSCQRSATPASQQPTMNLPPQEKAAASQEDLSKYYVSEEPCEAWKQNLARLNQEGRDALQRDGAVHRPNFMLSDELIPDCELRGAMSNYISRVINGQSEEKKLDRKFAAQHSSEIVQVLRRLWPSLSGSFALTGDGSFNQEKYNLLSESSLDEADLAPLIVDIVKKEGVNGALAYVLFSRPLKAMRATLWYQLEAAESASDIRQQIYCLALLQSLNEKTAYQRLRKISANNSLTPIEKKLVDSMLAKIDRGEALNFSDVEDLETQ